MDVIRLIFKGCLLGAATMATVTAQTTPSTQVGSSVLPSQATAAKREYVGQVGCRNCHKHDAIWDSFYKNPHYRSVASGKELPERTGCEGCHGPGKAHVDAGGDIQTVVYAFSLDELAEPKNLDILRSCSPILAPWSRARRAGCD